MQKEPNSIRPHIVLIGKRNVGKSSLINALTNQNLSLVSDIPGTTTDPVRKAFELLPFGPVVFIDTGGMDDVGELGEKRIDRSRQELAKADLALFVVEAGSWTKKEQERLDSLKATGKPYRIIVNKIDTVSDHSGQIEGAIEVSALSGQNVDLLKHELSEQLQSIVKKPFTVLGNMISSRSLVVLVVPIDYEAPQGRLILPQVMTIRDVLDHDAMSIIVKESELEEALNMLKQKPDIVITDSQVIESVAEIVSASIELTTFSAMFCKLKGHLPTFVEGARTLDRLEDGDRVLIAEACSHHPIQDDIATVKLPNWIRKYSGKNIRFASSQGSAYPEDLSKYRLVVHCAGCMITTQAMRVRMDMALKAGVPITNYGVAISFLHGLMERILKPLVEMETQSFRTGLLSI